MTHTEPVTDHHSKRLMIRAERHDPVVIGEVVDRFEEGHSTEDLTVVQRTDPYFGPKILLWSDKDESNYLLTAPGPESYLILWGPVRSESGARRGWQRVAEVKAYLGDDVSQYTMCPQCDEPLRTLQHERMAAISHCPDAKKEVET